jgi:hypothetical protein
MKPSYYVKAIWDPEASVWISETDIPGLVIEADTLGEFESLMVELAPQMLKANHEDHIANVPLVFSAHRELAIAEFRSRAV